MEELDSPSTQAMRALLCVEFEIAADCATQAGDAGGAVRFRQLASTLSDVDAVLIETYSELLDGLDDVEASSELCRRVGLSWFPTTAAEFVTKFISTRTGGGF